MVASFQLEGIDDEEKQSEIMSLRHDTASGGKCLIISYGMPERPAARPFGRARNTPVISSSVTGLRRESYDDGETSQIGL